MCSVTRAEVGEQHGRGGAGDTGHRVVLGDPVAVVAELFGSTGEQPRATERLTGSRPAGDRDEIEHGQPHGPAGALEVQLTVGGSGGGPGRAHQVRAVPGGLQWSGSTRRTIGSKVDIGSERYSGSKLTSSHSAQKSAVIWK